jgi:sulfur relay protein TusB/DsrH
LRELMSGVCLLITSSPTSPEGRQALDLTEGLLGAPDALTVCALQDAVVLACRKQPRETLHAMERLLACGATLCVLREDLALRGLASAELLDQAKLVDSRGVVELLAEDHGQVIGCL